MKAINEFINESGNTMKYQSLRAEDVEYSLTPGLHYSGDLCVIVGKPFTNEEDSQYILGKEVIKKLKYNINMDIKDVYDDMGEAADDVDYFVWAVSNNQASVFAYGEDGVVGII